MQLTQLGLINTFPSRIKASDRIFVIASFGQSNAIGRAESGRLALTTYPDQPANVQIYYKPDYTSALNGGFEPYSAGFHTIEPDLSAAYTLYSQTLVAAYRLRDYSGNMVYIIPMGDGGIALEQNLTSPDWSPASTGECFDIFTQYYWDRAIANIIALNPGKVITPIIIWAQGETDATDGTATADYATNFSALYTALRAHGTYASYLTAAPWIIPTLNYQQDANETTINADFVAFAAGTGLGRVFVVDMSAQPRKIDLTSGEKGGIVATSPTGDDEHLSYKAQNYLGEQISTITKTFYGYTAPDPSEITTSAFNPSTITSTGVWLPCTSPKLSVNSDNFITNIVNDLSAGDFVPAASTSVRKKIDRLKASIWFSPITNSRCESATAIGSTMFGNAAGWSVSAHLKPRNGQPSNVCSIVHDIQNTASANNSRFLWSIENGSGKIYGILAIGGTAVQFRTLNSVFSAGAQLTETHIAVTCDGSLIRVYANGVLQALDVTLNGVVSGLVMTNYVNVTNKLQIGATRTGASTYNNFWYGRIRNLTIQPGVVYSVGDIANLMLN